MIKKLIPIFFVIIFLSGSAPAIEKAPDFSITDVNTGKEYRLSNFTGKIVLLDFMSISCEGCEELEAAMRELWPEYNDTAIFITIDVLSTDSPDELRAKNLPWIAGMDTESIHVEYGVTGIPRVIVIDREGYAVFVHEGVMNADELRSALDSAINSESWRVEIPQMSIYVIALFAGIASFFSPCSFPMLPGYMAYYFGIGKKESGYRKAVAGGGAAAIGMITVYLLVGALLLYSASLVSPYIPMLGIVVGAALIVLGILMFTPLQYDALLRPFRPLSSGIRRIFGRKEHGLAAKLFAYGVGYGSAATGCTAPVFLAVIMAAMSSSFMTGILALLIYSLSAGLLMVSVTLLMATVEHKAIDFLKRNTERIKMGSALMLIIVGAYLIGYHLI